MLYLALFLLSAAVAVFLKSKFVREPMLPRLACALLLLLSFIAGLVANFSSEEDSSARQLRQLGEAAAIIPAQQWSKKLGGSGTLLLITEGKKDNSGNSSDEELLATLKQQLPTYDWLSLKLTGPNLNSNDFDKISGKTLKGIICLASLPHDPDALDNLFLSQGELKSPTPFLVLNQISPGTRNFLRNHGPKFTWIEAKKSVATVAEKASSQELFDLNYDMVSGAQGASEAAVPRHPDDPPDDK